MSVRLDVYVCVRVVGGKKEQSASGYFQLCPYSYLMVFIGAKGQWWCVYVRFLTWRESAGVPLISLCCLFKNAWRSTTGSCDPLGVNLLSSKYQVTWPMKFHISRSTSSNKTLYSDPWE